MERYTNRQQVVGWAHRVSAVARVVATSVVLLALTTDVPSAQVGGAAPQTLEWQRDFLDQYCVACHNDRAQMAGLTLQTVALQRVGHPAQDDAVVWEKVIRKLRAQSMPPVGRRRPEPAAYERMASWLEGTIDASAAATPNPGRPVVHRLNRAEYTNAIRDLLALDIDGREWLPADDSGYGFDNIADVLSLSPSLLERYMIAAAGISQIAVGDPALRPTRKTYRTRPTFIQEGRMSDDLPFGSRGGLSVKHYFPVDGEYRVKIRLQRTHANQIKGLSEANTVEVRLDRERFTTFTVGGDGVINPWGAVMAASAYEQTADEGLEFSLDVVAGTRTIGVTFPEKRGLSEGVLEPRLSSASYEFAGDRDASMAVDSIEISGPYDGVRPDETPSRSRIFTCTPVGEAGTAEQTACATEILATLARGAFRRPVDEGDVEILLGFYRTGQAEGGFDRGIQKALRALLVDPEFLFRIDTAGEPAGTEPGAAYPITDIELASRLAFFLWSSIPDDELLTLAEQRRLSEPEVLEAQIRRMVDDPKSSALVENFGGQWLYLRNLPGVRPDPDAYPEFDDNLRDAFRTETELFLDSQLRADKSVVDLLTADYTFVNARLAEHYGMAGVHGNHFRRVPLGDGLRSGLLGHGSILTATSYPNRTSPTLRGKWMLENLLGAPPPAPPPNVPDLADSDVVSPRSVRERLEAHRANPVCASCHAQMDPLGLALEQFDAIGGVRTHDGESPIDASATLPDGSSFEGPNGVREHLLDQPDRFVSSLTEKLLTYALGRGLEAYDAPAVRRIVRSAEVEQYRWSALVRGIVESVPFRMRRSPQP
jgi:mono/diheme cytochrome c family protein